jgi:hypothetical protein
VIGRRPSVEFVETHGQQDARVEQVYQTEFEQGIRRCRGFDGGHEGEYVACETHSTVVCTDAEGLQWYACDEVRHQMPALKTEPLAAFLQRVRDSL